MDPTLTEQIEYYRARASEYDEWFLRQGRYDLGDAENARWRAEVEQVARELAAFNAAGKVLELAGGTGFWSQQLVRTASELTIVDASPETLAINRARLATVVAAAPQDTPRVRYVVADVFAWQPDAEYDAVVFTFWLSHVPPERFAEFWALVARCLRPGGRVFFLDSLGPESATFDHRQFHPGDVTATRELNDGRSFRIYKVFYRPEDLQARLHDLGWQAHVHHTSHYFLLGETSRSD